MRVCMFAMLLPAHVTGGMEIHSLELAKGVAAAGHEVVVITSRHPRGIERESVDGVEIHYVDSPPTSKRPLGPESLKRLERLHSARRFDVVHGQAHAAYYYVKSGLKGMLGVPLVTTLHGTPYSEIRSNLNQGWSRMLIPKLVFHVFNHYFRFRRLIRESDAVIAISDELAESIPREFGISPGRVKRVYNGIDAGRFRPSESKLRGKFKGKRIILSISVLHRQKGVQYLIRALKEVLERVPKAHLIVVGEGPYRGELEELSRKLGVSGNVTFAGSIPNAETVDYYNACDVFAIPTVRVEGLPLIELEAMSCGRPVVASDIGGIPSVIKDGVNGMLVKPGDVDGLAGKIAGVLGDAELASRLGSKARETIEAGFSRRRMAEETIKAYREITR